jgi:hypothetical protein
MYHRFDAYVDASFPRFDGALFDATVLASMTFIAQILAHFDASMLTWILLL